MAAGGRGDRTGRELVRRRDHHGVHSRGGEGVDLDALTVHGDRDAGQPAGGELVAQADRPGVLHGDGRRAAAAEDVSHEAAGLGEAIDDDGALGWGQHSPHPAQVAGEFLAQAGQPGRVAVAELVGQRRQRTGRSIGPAARGTCRLTAARGSTSG